MKSSPQLRLTLAASVLAIAGAVLWYFTPAPHPAPAPMVTQQTEPTTSPDALTPPPPAPPREPPVTELAAAPIPSSPAPVTPMTPVPAPAPVANTPPIVAGVNETFEPDEVAATRRMYLAHAPLREREVADPDSETNRRILQTMVLKALGTRVIHAAPETATP